jgi:DNA-binding transcriptional MerR regulator
MTDDTTYSIGELAELTGVSRRTVRYYVQRGLIDPPLGRGRGDHYAEDHVRQILRVRRLQLEGVPLDGMRVRDEPERAGGSSTARPKGLPPAAAPEPLPRTLVVRVDLAEGVTLEVRKSAAVPGARTLDRLARACAEILADDGRSRRRREGGEDDEEG